jgi:hypothetical protein
MELKSWKTDTHADKRGGSREWVPIPLRKLKRSVVSFSYPSLQVSRTITGYRRDWLSDRLLKAPSSLIDISIE